MGQACHRAVHAMENSISKGQSCSAGVSGQLLHARNGRCKAKPSCGSRTVFSLEARLSSNGVPGYPVFRSITDAIQHYHSDILQTTFATGHTRDRAWHPPCFETCIFHADLSARSAPCSTLEVLCSTEAQGRTSSGTEYSRYHVPRASRTGVRQRRGCKAKLAGNPGGAGLPGMVGR
jgi:hypothetical protein